MAGIADERVRWVCARGFYTCSYGLSLVGRAPCNVVAPEVLSSVCKQHKCDLYFMEKIFSIDRGEPLYDEDRYDKRPEEDDCIIKGRMATSPPTLE